MFCINKCSAVIGSIVESVAKQLLYFEDGYGARTHTRSTTHACMPYGLVSRYLESDQGTARHEKQGR